MVFFLKQIAPLAIYNIHLYKTAMGEVVQGQHYMIFLVLVIGEKLIGLNVGKCLHVYVGKKKKLVQID